MVKCFELNYLGIANYIFMTSLNFDVTQHQPIMTLRNCNEY